VPRQPLRTDVTIRIVEGGFPHSEIRGSKLIRSSPRLIAAYHVLHRLSAPRHPPNALKALDRSHDRCPQSYQPHGHMIRKTIYACRIDPSKTLSRWCPQRECRWVATSSNLFPLHNDKQRHSSSSFAGQQSAKPEFPGVWCLAQTRTWWSLSGSNRRPEACKATALPTELRPLLGKTTHSTVRRPLGRQALQPATDRSWWAWEDLNLRPHAYQARALTN
jgi:hypothetical protein